MGETISGFERLRRHVLGGELCSYCGGCSIACPIGAIRLEHEQPWLDGTCMNDCALCATVCPALAVHSNTADDGHGESGAPEYLVGRLRETKLLERAGSGGLISGIAIALLERRAVQAVLVTEFGGDRAWGATSYWATTPEQVLRAAKPKYALTPTVSMLNSIPASDSAAGVAFVGLPCQIESLSRIRKQKGRLSERARNALDRIQYVIGLWCGRNCKRDATESFIQRMGILPNSVTWVGYTRNSGGPNFSVRTGDGQVDAPLQEYLSYLFLEHTWTACEYCTNWYSARADLSIGGLDRPGLKLSGAIIHGERGRELIRLAESAGFIETSPMADDQQQRLRRKDLARRGRR